MSPLRLPGTAGPDYMFSFLLACCQTNPDPVEVRRLAGLCTDWDQLLKSAVRHRVAPLVFWTLNRICPDAAPPGVISQLREKFQENTRSNLRFAAELFRIMALLQHAGIQPVVFKGASLAWSIYESPGLRSMADLDLLLPECDIPRTVDVLISNGFRRRDSEADIRFFENAGEVALVRGCPPLGIDLHWRLGAVHYSDLDPTPLRARAVKIDLGGWNVPTFCPEDLITFLCVHGCAHRWSVLQWLCDIPRVIECLAVDWDEVLSRSMKMGAMRKVSLGLYIAHDLLKADVPKDVLSRISSRRTVSLASSIKEEMETGHLPSRYAEQALGFQLTEGTRRRWRFLWHRFKPTFYDWEFFHIPLRLFPLYFLARPIRLACVLLGVDGAQRENQSAGYPTH